MTLNISGARYEFEEPYIRPKNNPGSKFDWDWVIIGFLIDVGGKIRLLILSYWTKP